MGEYEVEYEDNDNEVYVYGTWVSPLRGHPETEGDFEYENQRRKE